MGRRAVEIVIIFFDILAVIALGIGQSEEALLQDRVLSVPQGNSKAQPVVVVAETGQAILAPVIGAGAGLIVGEVVPRIPVLAVVLPDRAPLSFAEIRPPLLPRRPLLARLVETRLFRRFRLFFGLPRHVLLLNVVSVSRPSVPGVPSNAHPYRNRSACHRDRSNAL